MNKKSEEFLGKLLEFFPLTKKEYIESINRYGEALETVIIEDIFMPEILKLLVANENQALLEDIFLYFEKIVNENDSYLINIFSITVLEILGNDKTVLEIAKQYMGSKTILLQIEVDKELGRI